jgi:hypothetical protein
MPAARRAFRHPGEGRGPASDTAALSPFPSPVAKQWEKVADRPDEGLFPSDGLADRGPHPPFGHLLPSCGREKGIGGRTSLSPCPDVIRASSPVAAKGCPARRPGMVRRGRGSRPPRRHADYSEWRHTDEVRGPACGCHNGISAFTMIMLGAMDTKSGALRSSILASVAHVDLGTFDARPSRSLKGSLWISSVPLRGKTRQKCSARGSDSAPEATAISADVATRYRLFSFLQTLVPSLQKCLVVSWAGEPAGLRCCASY